MDKCEKCGRLIDPDSEEVLTTKPSDNEPAKLFCSVRCLNVRVRDFSRPMPHFE